MLPVVRAVVTPAGKIQRRASLKHLSPDQPSMQPARLDIKQMLMHTHQTGINRVSMQIENLRSSGNLRAGAGADRSNLPVIEHHGLIGDRRRPGAIDDLHMGEGDDGIGNRDIWCQRRLRRLREAGERNSCQASGRKERGQRFASTEGLFDGFEGMSPCSTADKCLVKRFRRDAAAYSKNSRTSSRRCVTRYGGRLSMNTRPYRWRCSRGSSSTSTP